MIKLNFKKGFVDMSMGAGGKAMNRLISHLMKDRFYNVFLAQGEDQAILPQPTGKIAMTTDSYVISPYFFQGGNIGSLAIHGTVNDLAVGGAKPLYISVGFILEEGLPLADLKIIVESMAEAAKDAGVYIVTGDTKVVEKGKGDGIFINTTGVGVIENDVVSHSQFEVGDVVIINGNLAEHGVAVMSQREGLSFDTSIQSDATNLNDIISGVLALGVEIKSMRDPTRGGISATLNEWALQLKVKISIDEDNLPITSEVNSACELLGLDPLFIANEGKVLLVCKNKDANKILKNIRSHPKGKNAEIIASVIAKGSSGVIMETSFGGMRRVDWLSGEQLPRIC